MKQKIVSLDKKIQSLINQSINWFLQLIKLLLDHGAHVDTPNKAGDSPATLISQNPHNRVNLLNYMTLQCHAAQAIFKYGIPCEQLPVALHRFLEFHRE